MARRIWLGLLAALALNLITGPPALGASRELTVSAAASLTNAFPEIGRQFEKQNPGVRVICNFAASGPLLQQIAQGAPVDVFASADQKTMDQAQEKGLIVPASRRNFVSNTLVLIVPRGSRLTISALGDLQAPMVKRVAAGNPASVPAGRYAREALARAGLWKPLQPRLILGASVRQVLDYVSRGEVDAGFVFATDAAIARGKVKTVMEIQARPAIVYPAAIVSASPEKSLARAFLDFLSAPEGAAILSKYGFGRP